MSVAFFGTSKYALPVLESLKANFDLKLVVVMPDKPTGRKQALTPCATKVWAQENKIPNSLELTVDCDLGIVADYGRIIKKEIFERPKLGMFNLHFSKLPEFRGPSPVQFTLLRGDKTAWVTIFKLKHYPELQIKMDSGPILWQKGYPVDPTDTTESLYTKLFESVARELPGIDFKGPLTEQDHQMATYTRFLTRDDGFVDYAKLLEPKAYNLFRAYHPWPGLWTIKDGKRMKVLKCHLEGNRVVIDLIQFEGKKPQTFIP